MRYINNCNELLDFLYQLDIDYHSSNGDSYTFFDSFYINFQGDEYEVSVHYGTKDYVTLMPSNKYPKTVFGIITYIRGEFILQIFRGDSLYLDEAIGIKLPASIREEMIATIKDC